MNGAGEGRIDALFEARRRADRCALIFYLTAGYPSLDACERTVEALVEAGGDLIELGIPFSDPIADGPTIQLASQRALEQGVRVRDVLDLTARLRRRHPGLPIVLFSAYNPILRRGVERFADEAAQAGADGVLVPDLPPEAAGELRAAASARGLATVFLVAPTTPPERARRIVDASSGFVYYISLRGVTGARDALPPDVEPRVRALKALTTKPVAVGFGVSKPEQARAIAAFADGVIVGSALVRLMGQSAPEELEPRCATFARSLAEAIDEARRAPTPDTR